MQRHSLLYQEDEEGFPMKKRLSTILAVMFMAVILIPFTPVQAASTDVTGKMAGNREIKNISKMMTAYTTAMNLSEQSTTCLLYTSPSPRD